MGATEGFWRAEIWSHNMGTDLAAKDCVLGDHSEVEMDCREVRRAMFEVESSCGKSQAALAGNVRGSVGRLPTSPGLFTWSASELSTF